MASSKQIEAGKAVVILGMDSTALQRGLDAAQQQMAAFGKGVATFGAGLAAAGALVTAPFLYGLSVFSDWGNQTREAIRETGISFQELQGITAGTRVSIDELVPATAKMSAFLMEAANGSDTANRQLAQMGMTLQQLRGMTQAERINAFADGLNRIGDGAQRIAAQRAIFGRAALALNMEGGSAGMQQRAARHAEVFGVNTPADLALANSYNLAMKEMNLAIKGVWNAIGKAAAPAMTEFFQIVTKGIIWVREFIDANRPLLEIVFRVADGMVTAGAVIGILGGVIYGASYAFTFLSGAISIVGGLLAWLWGWTTFAATGFGVLSAVSWAWGAVSAGASAIAAGAIWAYNATIATAHFLTWGFKALLIVLGATVVLVAAAIYLALGGAIIAGVVALGYFLLKYTYTLDTLKNSFKIVGDYLMAHWAFVFDFLGYAVTFWLQPIIGVFTDLFSRIGPIVSDAVGRTVAGFTTLFSGLVGTATTSFGAMLDAFDAGDWKMIWEIIKITAQLAWAQILQFIEPTWNTWQDAALDVWTTISDFLVDTFEGAWVALRIMFVEGWAFLVAGFWNVAAELADSLFQTEAAANARNRALQIGRDLERDVFEINAEAGQAQSARDGERGERNIREAGLRNERDQAAAAGNEVEVALLQVQLDALAHEAWANQQIEEHYREMRRQGMAGNGGGGELPDLGKMKSLGTFGADFSGMFGSGDTEQARGNRIAAEAREIARRTAAATEAIAAAIGRGLLVR